MRKLLLTICVATALFTPPVAGSGEFNAQGQFIGGVDARVTSLLSQFPAGGPSLRAAIAVLLESNPNLADDVVFAALNGTPGQKEAIGFGIADAARFFATCIAETCRAAEAALRHAVIFADDLTRTAFVDVSGSDTASNIAPTPPIFIPGIGSIRCVSPAAPNGC
jgi:hypothetical protein